MEPDSELMIEKLGAQIIGFYSIFRIFDAKSVSHEFGGDAQPISRTRG